MMLPQGIAKAQLTDDQCAFCVHPTNANAIHRITAVYPSGDPVGNANFSVSGFMYTPEGVALIGASMYVNPIVGLGLYLSVAWDNYTWPAAYYYFNGAGWVEHISFTILIDRALDRNKKNFFYLRASVSSAGCSADIYNGSGGERMSFWGIGRGLVGSEWNNRQQQKEFA